MIEYLNPSGRIIILTGPKGERVEFKKFERKVLEPYYKRYVPRYIKVVKEITAPPKIPVPPPSIAPKPIVTSRTVQRQPQPDLMAAAQERLRQAREREERRKHMAIVRDTAAAVRNNKGRITTQTKRKIVGSTNMRGGVATQHYEEITQKLSFPVSNDIGVGILSYNRLDCLKRLVSSIRHFTNLKRTTVFISDESDNAAVKEYLKSINDMVVLQNKERLGVAGNTNRLMRCLARFNFKIILNDDVEVLNSGWENVYTNAMLGTGIHHFCFRQPGVYGAKPNDERIQQINNFKIKTITEKPHGAVIAYDDLAFKKVGFLDERFGMYGMEHVDWSHRVQMAGIQPAGYHDILGSDHFFKIHNDKSAVEHRTEHLSSSRVIYDQVKKDKNRIYVEPSAKSDVPGVTYVVPFRGLDRSNAIRVVALNLKAQAYPVIEIIMVEQDDKQTQGNLSPFKSIKYVLAKNWVVGQAFTKALACNVGVANATQDKLIIHDADMVVERGYTARMAELLDNYNAVHIGKNVVYLSKPACEKIYKTCSFTPDLSVERTVGYYEGGSLGCRFNVYVNIGGFDERFIGYGCEDTEFFARLSSVERFYNTRSVDLIHLWHSRTNGWKNHHDRNKDIEKRAYATPMTQRIGILFKTFKEKYNLTLH